MKFCITVLRYVYTHMLSKKKLFQGLYPFSAYILHSFVSKYILKSHSGLGKSLKHLLLILLHHHIFINICIIYSFTNSLIIKIINLSLSFIISNAIYSY